jgi:pimeloyl-ACP methyl ester carboxylesterase
MTEGIKIRATSARQGGSYSGLPNLRVNAANGIDYAYRDTSPAGNTGTPLVLLQRFRGNLHNWDPALIHELASKGRVLAFDNAGVGCSTGSNARHCRADGLRRRGRMDAAARDGR